MWVWTILGKEVRDERGQSEEEGEREKRQRGGGKWVQTLREETMSQKRRKNSSTESSILY